MKTVWLINQSKKLHNPDYVIQLALGMSEFAQKDVCPTWEKEPWTVHPGRGAIHLIKNPTQDVMIIYLVDEFADKTLTGILGYHEVVGGIPVGYVNVSLCWSIFGDAHFDGITPKPIDMITPYSVSEVLSHEFAEMIIDPFINLFSQNVDKKMWQMEVADPSDKFRYTKEIKWTALTVNSKTVNHFRYMTFQDFVTPEFYRPGGQPPYSHTGAVTAPFNLDGGYENVINGDMGYKIPEEVKPPTPIKIVEPIKNFIKKPVPVIVEKPHPWLCAAGVQLRKEIDLRWPDRIKTQDGWIGDWRHVLQGSTSQHNPDPITGVVRAIDIDIHLDPKDPAAAMKLADALRAIAHGDQRPPLLTRILRRWTGAEKRFYYIIFNHNITSGTYRKTWWTWRKFDGDPHTKHIHISFNPSGDHDGSPIL